MNPDAEFGEMRKASGAGRSIRVFLAMFAIVAGMVAVGAWWRMPPPNPLARSERVHGIHLPPSATNIQSRGDAWHGFLDRGEATLFEMKSSDLAGFIAGLTVRSRALPVSTSPADPLVNGWNVWPHVTGSYVSANSQYGGFSRTWAGDAVPVEMLSCASPTGDWLHVEYWKLPEDSLLVKMYTDWN